MCRLILRPSTFESVVDVSNRISGSAVRRYRVGDLRHARRQAMSVNCSDPRQDRRDNTIAAGRAEGKELARAYTGLAVERPPYQGTRAMQPYFHRLLGDFQH